MQKTTLLFDFDLTLADSSLGIFQCINFALEEMGFQKLDFETIKLTIGLSLPDTFGQLTDNKEVSKAKQFTALFIQKADEVMNENTVVFPEVFQLMPKIRKLGFKTGIVSTKYRYRIQGILKREKLDNFFDVIIGGEDVRAHKPNPEGLLLAIKKSGAERQNVLYIGDSLVDAEAAKLAKIDFIAMLTGTVSINQFQNENCLYILPNLDHLLDLIKRVVF